MHRSTQPFFACLGMILGICSCKPPGDDPGEVINATSLGETEGVAGIFMPEFDLPDDESEPAFLPTGQCIQVPQPGVFGYVHQCEGTVRLGFDAASQVGEDAFDFGPGESNPLYWLEPDSYDLPLVAACCGPFDYENPTTEEKLPYVNNCLTDAVQQTCHGIPYLLRRQAELTDNLLKKAAINTLATDLENREGECLLALFGGGASSDAPNRLANTTWSPKDNVTFTLIEAEVTDWTEEGEVEWNTCMGMFDNDPAVIPTVPFELPGTVAVANATLVASSGATGSGPGGLSASFAIASSPSTLALVRDDDGVLHVSGFRLVAERSSGSSDEVSVGHASLVLRNPAPARAIRGEWMVDAGSAHFVASVTLEGESRAVDMTNTTAIVLRETAGDWEVRAFELGYDDPYSGAWSVWVGASSFRSQPR